MPDRKLINPRELFAAPGFTGSTQHPAQTIIGVTGLAVPGLLIEIEATALID